MDTHLIDIKLQKQEAAAGAASGVIGGTVSTTADSVSKNDSLDRSSTQTTKIIQASSLQLLVKDVDEANNQITNVTESIHGEIEKADISGAQGSTRAGEILVRVPAREMDAAVAAFRKNAIRVQSEHRESRDITREYMDSEARLRNLKAEEEQYLALLRRAGSMKDTLQVTEKISEVRGEIEQLQGELNWWSHQVAMSAIHISLAEEPQATVAARWRPVFNAKNNLHEMLLGLGEWVDWVVAFLIDIPLILVWVCSVGGLLLGLWKIGRYAWMRWLKPKPAPEPQAAS